MPSFFDYDLSGDFSSESEDLINLSSKTLSNSSVTNISDVSSYNEMFDKDINRAIHICKK